MRGFKKGEKVMFGPITLGVAIDATTVRFDLNSFQGAGDDLASAEASQKPKRSDVDEGSKEIIYGCSKCGTNKNLVQRRSWEKDIIQAYCSPCLNDNMVIWFPSSDK